MSDPCELTISRVKNVGEGVVVRIEARDGLKVLARLEMSEQDFVHATLGGAIVTAAIALKAEP